MKAYACIAALLIVSSGAGAQRARTQVAATRNITIVAEPDAIIWIDDIRRGVTDNKGMTRLKLSAGAHTLRARAMGFKEISIPIPAAQRESLLLRMVRTTDQAELLFQKAENARETAKDDA